jgi:hypothetical protein
MILRVSLIIISAILLGAHFLRDGNLLLTVVCLLTPALLFIRRLWVLWLLQGLAYLGAVIWLVTLAQLVMERIAMGRSYGVSVAILGTVALFTIVSGVLLNSEVMQRRYADPTSPEAQ